MKIGIRVWVLLIAIFLSVLAISPSFQSGVIVKSVGSNSSAFAEGLRSGEIIIEINGQKVEDKLSYSQIIDSIFIDNETKKMNIKTKKNEYVLYENNVPDITIDNVPMTKIQTGLDLRGGARALVQPDVPITDAQLDDLIQVSTNRFNVFGLSDVQIKGVSDLSGNKFMLVEVAGATPADLEELIAQQGKFEAKVGNTTVFTGGKNDIASVCRNDATCAGIVACNPDTQSGGYA